MNVDLEVKEPHTIQVEVPQLTVVEPVGQAEEVEEAEELLDQLQNKNQRLFTYTGLVFTYADTAEALDHQTARSWRRRASAPSRWSRFRTASARA